MGHKNSGQKSAAVIPPFTRADADATTDPLDHAAALHDRAVELRGRGGMNEAKALEIKEKLLGPEHPDVAMTLNNLGMFLQFEGRFDEAEPLCRRALLVFERVQGAGGPRARTCRENYAGLLRAMGRKAEAAQLIARGRGRHPS